IVGLKFVDPPPSRDNVEVESCSNEEKSNWKQRNKEDSNLGKILSSRLKNSKFQSPAQTVAKAGNPSTRARTLSRA
ncbi:unnamed protein product, partial [Dovyalis caffra]